MQALTSEVFYAEDWSLASFLYADDFIIKTEVLDSVQEAVRSFRMPALVRLLGSANEDGKLGPLRAVR